MLVEADRRTLFALDQRGRTPLHDAAVGFNFGVCKFLIEEDPEAIDVRDCTGRTPLHAFVSVMIPPCSDSPDWIREMFVKEYVVLAELFANAGANLRSIDNAGCTVYDAAVRQEIAVVFNFLRRRGVSK
ncbi:hypothetical protein HDU96_004119 [Phlyctochytrium bullatum]|nr:hypothetical protein HDU96_004119 [Phlyctochytrium bullatum]